MARIQRGAPSHAAESVFDLAGATSELQLAQLELEAIDPAGPPLERRRHEQAAMRRVELAQRFLRVILSRHAPAT